ncbi:MAG: xylulose kinase, partial [Chloroflexi bacterium]
DLGTSGAKVALVTTCGRVLDWEARPVALLVTPDGGVEQSPEEWWQAMTGATCALLARNSEARAAVRALCCSTQGEGTVPVDRDGRVLMNCILWMDMRGAPYVKKQFRGAVNVQGISLARALRWIYLTGGMPSLTGKDPAGHMLLVKERFPKIYDRTYKFLNVLDYLNLRLTGCFTATYDSILTSWVTDNRRPDAIRYAPALVRDCGVDAEKLPEIVPCTSVLGSLTAQAAADLGLSRDVQVVAGAIDTTAAAIGSGAVEDYLPHLYIGTSAWIAAHVPFKKTDSVAKLASVPCAVPGRYLMTALQATAGGNLTFLRDNILYHKDELLQEANVPDIFKVLDQIAERVPPGANGLIYTPWIWGERAPVEDPNLRGGVYNLSICNNREDIIRAFLEGVALNTRWLLKSVQSFLGRKPQTMHIAGGGAQSDVWCQIFADALNLEIRQVQNPIQVNARGAAWIAAAALGEMTLVEAARKVEFNRVYSPDPLNRALYDDRFEVFTQIYRQMKPVFKRINR